MSAVLRAFALLVALLLLVAACEVEEDPEDVAEEPEEEEPEEPEEEEEPEEDEEPEDEPDEVVREEADLVIWADDTRTPALEPFAEEFGDDEGVEVAVQEVPFDEIDERVIDAAPAGEGPDIFIGAHDWLGRLVDAGVVSSIDISGIEDDLVDVAVEAFTFDESTYGVPYATENVGFFRNTELVPDELEDWDEVVEIGTELQEDGEVEYPLVTNMEPADPFHKYPFFTAYGGYVFGQEDDGTYDPSDLGIDSEGAIAAGEAMQEWLEMDFTSADISPDIMEELFGGGDAAFAVTGPWSTPVFDDADVEYQVDAFPEIEGGTAQPFVGVQGFMVSAFAESELLAETFLVDYMATQEAQLELFDADPRPPAMESAFDEVADDPNIEGFGEAGIDGQPMPAIPEMDSVWEAWTDGYELIFEGEDPEEAFGTAAEQIRELIDQ